MWSALVTLFILTVRAVSAKDGLIDWTKTPGGGPSTLRGCAQYAYNDSARGGGSVNGYLGCTTNACVCRTDLIDKAHDHIQYIVELNCGTDAEVDIQAAIKIYNDYCSANGFPIPGYTYVITQTIEPPTETPLSAESSALAVASITSDQPPTDATLTQTINNIITVTAPPTARITVVVSSANLRSHIFPWFRLFCGVTFIPFKYSFGLP
ncbi:hypothetical protein P154DRAFT_522936 [Amniculicola lignicola CBS 123094]|uniref:Uncharacterized protein n=1 Tax=Amniculicola lignicola CBS 123094 TaxID=1392246 RepID=A0A6A5WDB3_9PLEO|nr:hypothetical protein P154DRAFT_522936 [Amniculicola lignicola CBS 123094]